MGFSLFAAVDFNNRLEEISRKTESFKIWEEPANYADSLSELWQKNEKLFMLYCDRDKLSRADMSIDMLTFYGKENDIYFFRRELSRFKSIIKELKDENIPSLTAVF